jgi:hypothetical protein
VQAHIFSPKRLTKYGKNIKPQLILKNKKGEKSINPFYVSFIYLAFYIFISFILMPSTPLIIYFLQHTTDNRIMVILVFIIITLPQYMIIDKIVGWENKKYYNYFDDFDIMDHKRRTLWKIITSFTLVFLFGLTMFLYIILF